MSHGVLSEVSLSDLERNNRRIRSATGVSIVQAQGAGRSTGVECATRPCASGSIHTAEICSLRIHGLPERQSGAAGDSHKNYVTIRLSLLKGDKFIKEIAVKINVNERSVRRWRQAQRHPRKQSTRLAGQLPYLTDKQRKKLEQELLKGANAHGSCEDYWTLDRVGHVIWELFKIRYSPSDVWRLLDRMNWSCHKVQRIALQRSDEAIICWQQQVRPRI